eukprot:623466-Pyramimonas_sp.AAC.1
MDILRQVSAEMIVPGSAGVLGAVDRALGPLSVAWARGSAEANLSPQPGGAPTSHRANTRSSLPAAHKQR